MEPEAPGLDNSLRGELQNEICKKLNILYYYQLFKMLLRKKLKITCNI